MLHLPECQLVLDKLKKDLPSYLHYHTIDHTLDVYDSAKFIAINEGVSNLDLKIILIAAIYHDAGYLKQNQGHEELSCEMAREYLSKFNYSATAIDKVCTLIMATKVPQEPKSLLEQIICDADMDYLGREDFPRIGEKLYLEFLESGNQMTREQWNAMQISFLKKHHYFTPTAIKFRQETKDKNLNILIHQNDLL
jgi:predicted metal-dependent HD superfamily phosphohydrolase